MNKDQIIPDHFSVNCSNKGYCHLIGCGLICSNGFVVNTLYKLPREIVYLQGHLQLHLQTFACACSQLISMVLSVSCTISEQFFIVFSGWQENTITSN